MIPTSELDVVGAGVLGLGAAGLGPGGLGVLGLGTGGLGVLGLGTGGLGVLAGAAVVVAFLVVRTARVVVFAAVVVFTMGLVVGAAVPVLSTLTEVGSTIVDKLPMLSLLNCELTALLVIACNTVSALDWSAATIISVSTFTVSAAARRRLSWKLLADTMLGVSTVTLKMVAGVVHEDSYLFPVIVIGD